MFHTRTVYFTGGSQGCSFMMNFRLEVGAVGCKVSLAKNSGGQLTVDTSQYPHA